MQISVPENADGGWETAAGMPASPPAELRRYDVAFPFHVEAHGRVAGAHYDDHVAQMIEQVLFTAPGERPDRPDFGCGVLQMVFGPDAGTQAAATQFLVTANLQRWLGELIQVQSVAVVANDARLEIVIQYVVRLTGDARTRRFPASGA